MKARELSPTVRPGFDTSQIEPTAFFALAFLVCFAVRASTLGENVWEQELVAAATIERDWASLFQDRFAAGEPPFYYALLKALGLAGAPELWLRLPSAILDSLGCATLAWLAHRISGRVGGIALILTFAFMPVLIRFGQEARPYPLLCFFFALSLAAATILWRAPRQAVSAFGSGRPRRHRTLMRGAAIALVIAMVGAGWTMVMGWLAIALLQLSVLVSPRLLRVPGMLRLWLVLCAVAWAAIAPCIFAVGPNLHHFTAILWTADAYAVTFAGIAADIRSIYGWSAEGDLNRFFPGGWETYLGLALFVLAAISIVRHTRPPIRQAAFVAVALPILLFGADIGRSLVALRHIHPSLWCLCLLYADGAALVARRWPGRIILGVLAVGVVLQGIDGAEAERKTSWEPFLQFFRDNQLAAMKGYVTEPALAVLVERSLPEGSPPPRIEVDERPPALRTALSRALSADAPIWILTARPLGNVVADLPPGVASCAGTIGYHAFIVAARSFDLLPTAIRDCAKARPGG